MEELSIFNCGSIDYIPVPRMPISNVKCWGPSMWTVMHTISLNHPIHPSNEEKKAVISFFNSLRIILPCQVCKEHFNQIIDRLPSIESAVETQETLVHWVFNLHNAINAIANRSSISFKEFIELYEIKSRTM